MSSGKTAAGNTAAVREALELAAQALPFTVLTHIDDMPIGDVIDKVDAALTKPPRNCDVGTAEEQRERFAQFCRNCKRNRCGFHPKAQFIDLCALAWAQMPYEAKEGGTE